MKRVLLLVVDALTAPSLLAEMDNGRYPNLQKLRENGVLREQCVSIFPSITHAALSSIVTGKYPAQHGVVGSHWYDVDEAEVIYLSGSVGMVLRKGPGTFFYDLLVDLNQRFLTAPTIFQQLEREGYETASINFIVYRGDVAHEVNVPLLLEWIPDLPAHTTVKGPQKLLLGNLLANPDDLDVKAKQTGLSDWFGFRDENTFDLVLQLAETDEFPDFTLAYFPENDDRAHEDGPVEAHKHLSGLDDMLGGLFAEYGGLESFLQQFTLIITGDHSQSETAVAETEEGIDLEQVLSDYQLAEAGHPWDDGDEIMACPNLRTAVLYFKTATSDLAQDVTAQLLAEPRIDQVIYRAGLTGEDDGYVVRTRHGRLRFWREDEGTAVDRYGNSWAWEGDLGVVDGRVQDDCITFPDYPNAFERITGLLDADNSGHLWLTAQVGYEIMVPPIETYAAGGSHAALHRLDSQPPLFVAGAPSGVTIPQFPRLTDIAPLCRACLEES